MTDISSTLTACRMELVANYRWPSFSVDRFSFSLLTKPLNSLFQEQVSPKGVYQQVIKNERSLEKKMQNANEWKEVESLQVKAGVMWGNILPVWVTFSLWLIFLSADKNKWLTKKEGRGQMIWISGMKWHISERQSHMCSWANACPDVLIKKKISYSTVLEDETYS